MTVQLQKIIRDLWIYRLRTGLSIFAITVGIILFGAIGTARDTLKSSYEQAFRSAHPAQVVVQISAFESNLLRRIELIDGVVESSARFVTGSARARVSIDEWLPLELHASDDYSSVGLHRIFPESQTFGYTPERGEVWLDRSILQRNALAIGDSIEVQTPFGDKHILRISGFVNDVIAYPSHLSDQAVAYISNDTLKDIQLAVFLRPNQPAYNQLYLRFDSPSDDTLRIRSFMQDVQDEIEQAGDRIISAEYLSDAPPLETQTSVLDTLLILSTVFTFGVTGVMIGNFVSAIVGRQVTEIGIMKSLGAVPSQVIKLFFTMMMMIGLISFVLSIPLTGYVAQALSQFLVNLIDIDVGNVVVTNEIRLTQLLSAIFIPILASVVPIIQGSTLTVSETLRSDGNVKSGWVKKVSFIPRLIIPNIIFQMAVLNTFLKSGRFALTVISLTLPGALFISSFGIETALQDLDASLASSLFDYNIEFSFNGYEAIPQLTRLAEKQPNIQYVEAWRQGSIYRIYGPVAGNPLPPQSINESNATNSAPVATEEVLDSPPPLANGENGNRPPPPISGTTGNRLPPPINEGNGNRPPPPVNGGNGNRPPPPANGGNTNQLASNSVDENSSIPSDNGENETRLAPPPQDGPATTTVSGNILLRGVPLDSRIIGFSGKQLLGGAWLQNEDELLLTYEAYRAFSLYVDRSSEIAVGAGTNEDKVWTIAGVTGQMLMTEGFVAIDSFEKLIPSYASSIRLAIITTNTNPAEVQRTLENLREVYNRQEIAVNSSISIQEFVERRAERLSIVTQTLILLAVLIEAVSVIGLISTISINTRERTKSIGILRSLGGDYRHLGTMVFVESLTIVFISYVLAFMLSEWFGHEISSILGQQMYSLDATYNLELTGCIIWFVVMIVVGIVAALGPALYAINITISDTLRYEG